MNDHSRNRKTFEALRGFKELLSGLKREGKSEPGDVIFFGSPEELEEMTELEEIPVFDPGKLVKHPEMDDERRRVNYRWQELGSREHGVVCRNCRYFSETALGVSSGSDGVVKHLNCVVLVSLGSAMPVEDFGVCDEWGGRLG